MAESNRKRKGSKHGTRVEWACQACGKLMRTTPSTVRQCCSKSCSSRLRPKRLTAPRETCPHCGREFAARMSGGERMRHCSRRCSEARRRLDTEAKAAAVRLVRDEVAALGRISRYIERPPIFKRPCEGCGAEMVVRRGGGGHRTKCDDCKSSVRAQSARVYRKTDLGRKHRRVQKSRRRAMERGALAERIDPIAVFQRDGWKCQLCGRRTPEHRRGSYKDDAPELDHIIPLARGGTHTWSNVQCSCRKCNLAKGATAIGQLTLGFAA